MIWLGLLVLTGLTVAVAGIQLQYLAVIVALSIATLKSILVITYFMHLKYEGRLFKHIVIFILSVLAITLILTYADVIYR